MFLNKISKEKVYSALYVFSVTYVPIALPTLYWTVTIQLSSLGGAVTSKWLTVSNKKDENVKYR